MTILFEARPSDSPYIETVTQGRTATDGTTIRPSEIHWHMVLSRSYAGTDFYVVGPWTSAGELSYAGGAELLWIRFRMGTFMPWLPTGKIRNMQTTLPMGAGQSVWLHGSTWKFPTFENVETFVSRLVREEALTIDPVVKAALNHQQPDVASRTVRHRFQRVTGLTQKHIDQYERAQRAASLLEQGWSILDTVYEAGFFDQPHMTRALKQFIGFTPAQIVRSRQTECRTELSPADLLEISQPETA